VPAEAPLLGCEVPRIYTPPLRELTPETSKGFECIAFAENVLGLSLWPWQKWLLIHALELNPDGTYRFRTVVLLVARQNGKSTIMQVLTLWRMYLDAARLVIGTAQNLDIAEDVWGGAVEIAESIPELSEQIQHVYRNNGKKALVLESGEKYKVQAANRKGGRGLSGDLVIMDELREHSNWDAWGAVTKTTLARALAQVWAASNAGDASSIVLAYLRKLAHAALGNPDGLEGLEALAGDPDAEEGADDGGDSLGLFEWSATPGCSVWDRREWARANPSLGYTITEKAIASAIRTDPARVARTEVLCQWVDTAKDGPFPEGVWAKALDPESSIVGRYALAVDVSSDRSMAYIAAAGFREDGRPHVEVVAARAGTAWVLEWFTTAPEGSAVPRFKDPDLAVVTMQHNGAPVSSLTADFEEDKTPGMPYKPWAGSDLGKGTGMFFDHVTGPMVDSEGNAIPPADLEPVLRHRDSPALDIAASMAVAKPAGDSWLWDRHKSPVDIAPLVACTGALWAFLVHGQKPAKKRSKYEDVDLLTV
jgi:hypothetical protein